MMSRQLAGLVNENIRPNGSVTIWFQLLGTRPYQSMRVCVALVSFIFLY